MNLSPFDSIPSTDSLNAFEEAISGCLIVGLSAELRLSVIGHLIAVKSAVQFDSLVVDETKRNLVTENRRIAVQLVELLCKDGEPKNQTGRSLIKLDNYNYRIIIRLVGKRKSQLLSVSSTQTKVDSQSQEDQIASLEARLETRIDGLRSELKRKISEVNTCREEVSFRFDLADVFKFFESDSQQFSRSFWCRNLQWSLYVERTLDKAGSMHLGLYLHCYNSEQTKWTCRTSFDLILFSQRPEIRNHVRKCVFTPTHGS